jgi:hypothetical protein
MKSIAKHPKKNNLHFKIDFLINFTHSGVLGKTLLSSIPAKCSETPKELLEGSTENKKKAKKYVEK